MKDKIHPKLHAIKVHCSCGNEFETLATVSEMRLDICGACHPFYTGKKRDFAAAGRVQKFEQKYANVAAAPPKPKKEKKVEAKKPLARKPALAKIGAKPAPGKDGAKPASKDGAKPASKDGAKKDAASKDAPKTKA